MKKYFIALVVLVAIVSVFGFGQSTLAATSKTATLTMTQFVDLLISIGVITPDKIVPAKVWADQADKIAKTPTASTTAYIQVLTPDDSVDWELTRTVPYEVTWGSLGVANVRLALLGGKMGTCEVTPTPVASKDGNHFFKITPRTTKCFNLKTGTSTALTSGTYHLKVYGQDAKGIAVSDQGNASINLKDVPIPALRVTYPNGGESLLRKMDYDVTYTRENFDRSINDMIYLDLIDTKGQSVFSQKRLFHNGVLSLDFPSDLAAGAYKVRLRVTTYKEKLELSDESDNYFWVSTGLQ